MEILNSAGSCISPEMARTALVMIYRAGIDRPLACHWLMSPVQKVMLENMGVPVTVLTEVGPKPIPASAVKPSVSTEITLCGVNVVIDSEMPADVIELRYGREIIVRIIALALPIGYR